MRSCSTASETLGASWLSGATTIAMSGRTRRWATEHRHKRAGRSCKIEAGRRNWLFVGSRADGERAAAIYAVLKTPAFAGAGSARPTVSIRSPISPTSSPRSQATGQPAAGTNSCPGTGCRRQISRTHKLHDPQFPRHAYSLPRDHRGEAV